MHVHDCFSLYVCVCAFRYDDGLFEVVAVKGAAQMGAIKSLPGVITPFRLAQASHVRISIREGDPLPIQVDGEAFMQEAATLTIFHKGRVQMLCRDRALQRLLHTWGGTESDMNNAVDTTDVTMSALLIASLNSARTRLVSAIRTVGVQVPHVAIALDDACTASDIAASRLLKVRAWRCGVAGWCELRLYFLV